MGCRVFIHGTTMVPLVAGVTPAPQPTIATVTHEPAGRHKKSHPPSRLSGQTFGELRHFS